ncbi:glycosyltransferase family 2 protein [Aeromonas veronii]|uniref:glycosyltransferase family 2 protein n=1 Tax=Aeromonas veronii TaxID=654 RepID=UPI00191F9AAE|nr:glycosyltransferase family A protein [Aeromonas veronii]MBL0472452.1 glycosyltransferase family 2 protein [Aeromonas veronii]
MLISIIIPCYQQEKYLSRALDSIKLQKYYPLEVIVVDDGSVEPITLSVREYDFPIKLIRQSNQGLSAARNTGIKHSKGKLIKFLDADDTLLPGCLTAQATCMGQSSGAICIIGYKEIDEENDTLCDVYPAFGDAISALMIDNLAPVHSFLFHKHDLIAVEGFNTTTRTNGGCEDYDLIFRMALNGCFFINLHKIGVAYHRRSGSMSTNVEKMKKAMLDVWLYNILTLLKSHDKMHELYILPILSGLSLRLDKRPIAIPCELDLLVAEIIRYLAHIENGINQGGLQLLLGLMQRHVELSALSQFLKSISTPTSSSLSIKPQELLDYRMYLLGTGYRFDDQRLYKILSLAKTHNHRFAIYGAGDIGYRIYSLLQTVDLTPAFLLDRNTTRSDYKYNIPLLPPDKINIINVDAIIIASDAYYQEIYELLMSIRSDIEVV